MWCSSLHNRSKHGRYWFFLHHPTLLSAFDKGVDDFNVNRNPPKRGAREGGQIAEKSKCGGQTRQPA